MTDHRWAVVAVTILDADAAADLAAMDVTDRLDHVCEIIGQRAPGEISGGPETVRGPLCTECRVHWRDVYAQPDKPWPCYGQRPAALGGPLVPPDLRMPRQQRRRAQRAAAKAKEPAPIDVAALLEAVERTITVSRDLRVQ